jgi:hypothetical protein
MKLRRRQRKRLIVLPNWVMTLMPRKSRLR